MIVLFYYVLIIFFLVYKMLHVSGLLQRSMRRVVSVCPMAVSVFLSKKVWNWKALNFSMCLDLWKQYERKSRPAEAFFSTCPILLCGCYIFLCCCFHRSKWFLEVAKSKRVGYHFSLTRFFIYPAITFSHFLQNFALLPDITSILSNPGYLRLPWRREWEPLRLELVTSSCISEIFLTVSTFVCRSLRCSHLDRFCPHGNIADGSVLFLCPVCYLWPGDSSASCNTGQRQNI